ncbi:ElaA protein [Rhodoferax ferrireducens]|uniref:ElaA protein n=1 Tax=Rhodoferax ferrireducens TaxID=192843 RepID=A0ABU2CED3_9BURK|nr:GNAT family N-acetyltransferase [Rhodoferax ferrireducens]MDR7379707.1 ElaA protein [Rhodoferax ferrireducens]
MPSPELRVQWARLDGLSARELHAALQLRSAVFVVEQNCVYHDVDDYDLQCWHLLAWSGDQLAAYLRVTDPGSKYPEPSLGRVLTAPAFRGQGLGQLLLTEALQRCAQTWPGQPNRISAQHYLLKFYQGFGFAPVSEVYQEDEIPHVEMLRPAA